MQFLKILFWCLLAFVAALFTYGNWQPVAINLWGGLQALVNLPLLLFATFLIGFVPTQAYHAARRWRLRQRLAQAEAALAESRALLAMPAPVGPTAVPPSPAALPDAAPPLAPAPTALP